MLSGLAGKVAVVTGGAGGIGSATARRLSAEGCRVVVVATEADVDEYLDVATRTFGKIDFHHLSAGIPGSPGGFPELDAADFDRVMAVNVRGVLLGLRDAAMYGGPLGIRVNAVAPGIVPTDLFAAAGKADMVRRASTAPLRRAGTTGEIASVVAFLLSEESAYMTGEVVSVDGGSAIVSTVRPSGGAGAWDFAALDQRTYRGEE